MREFAHSLAAATPDGTMPLPFEAFQQALMQDEPELAQRIVFDQLLPQPGGCMEDASEVGDVTTAGIRAAYVLSREDRSLPLPDAEFAAQLGVEPILIPRHTRSAAHPPRRRGTGSAQGLTCRQRAHGQGQGRPVRAMTQCRGTSRCRRSAGGSDNGECVTGLGAAVRGTA